MEFLLFWLWKDLQLFDFFRICDPFGWIVWPVCFELFQELSSLLLKNSWRLRLVNHWRLLSTKKIICTCRPMCGVARWKAWCLHCTSPSIPRSSVQRLPTFGHHGEMSLWQTYGTFNRAKHNPSSYGHKNDQFRSFFNTDLGVEMSRPPPQRPSGSMRAARL